MVWGDVRHSFARYIHNGETAVLVQAEDDAEAQAAADILGLYAPLAVETRRSARRRSTRRRSSAPAGAVAGKNLGRRG